MADGDIALIKLAQGGLPVVEIGSGGLTGDAQLVQLAFGTNDTNVDGATYTLRSRLTRLVGEQGKRRPAVYKMDGDLGGSAHGGMVVDLSGRVVGMIDRDFGDKDKTSFLAVDLSGLGDLLTAAGVTNNTGPMDQVYRDGLDAYFAGRYSEAIGKLDAVLSAAPGHLPAAAYRKQAADRYAVEGDPASGTPTWVYVMIAVFSGLVALLVAVIVMMVLRGRSRRAPIGPFPPASGIPVSGFPISGQPVSGHPVSGGGYGYGEGVSIPQPMPPNEGAADGNPWAPPPER